MSVTSSISTVPPVSTGSELVGEGGASPLLPESRSALAAWWLGVRWLAVAGFALAVYLAAEPMRVIPAQAAGTLWLLVAGLAVFDVALTVLGPRRVFAPALVALQLGVDTCVLLAALHLAGGVSNPFVTLVVGHAALSALVLSRRPARLLVGLTATTLLALAMLEASGKWPPGCLLDRSGTCRLPDAPQLVTWGATIALTLIGCALVVARLGEETRRGRDRARAEAARLAASEQALMTERTKLESVVRCMADAVVVASARGEIVLCNDAARSLWTAGRGPDLGVCHGEERWRQILADLDGVGSDAAHPSLTLGARTFEPSWAKVCSPSGELLGVVMVARDVTDRLREAASRVDRERMSTIGRLAAALAHELNNPLAAIAMFTQHAQTQVAAGSPLGLHLATVRRNAEQCARIVSDLLRYARQRPPSRSVLDPAELIADTVRTLEPQARRSRVEIEAAVEARELIGDGDQLRQVLVNLGLNAVDAMPDGGRLRIAAREVEGAVCLEVTDTGTGISPGVRDRIFAPFFTTKATGTGLGLAVVHDLVAAHGGSIDLESATGRGTTFSIRLPRAAAGEAS